MCSLRKAYKVFLLLLLNIAALLSGIIITVFLRGDGRVGAGAKCMSLWARCTCIILGIRVRLTGIGEIPEGSFVVSNHCSYLDIVILGGIIPGIFVAKEELAAWPVAGILIKLAGTIFVNRASRMSVPHTLSSIKSRVLSGISIFVFPEGTTNNGRDILAFKSPLFKIAVERRIPVIPVTIIYSHIDEKPVRENEMDHIAWHGNMSLLPHLWNVLGLKSIRADVHLNAIIKDIMTLDASRARKLVCSFAFESIRAEYKSLQSNNHHDALTPKKGRIAVLNAASR